MMQGYAIITVKAMRQFIQQWVLKTSHYPIFFFLYKQIYRWGHRLILKELGVLEGVKCLYIRGGSDSYVGVPGSSDIDVIVVTENLRPAEEWALWQRIKRKTDRLMRLLAFFCDTKTLSEKDFKDYVRFNSLLLPDRVNEKIKESYGKKIQVQNFDFNLKERDYAHLIKINLREVNDYIFSYRQRKHMMRLVRPLRRMMNAIESISEAQSFVRLRRGVEKIEADHYFSKDPMATALSFWAECLKVFGEHSHQLKTVQSEGVSESYEKAASVKATTLLCPQESYENNQTALMSFVREIESLKVIKKILIGSNWSCAYQYDIYILIDSSLDQDLLIKGLCDLLNAYEKHKTMLESHHFQEPFVIAEEGFNYFCDMFFEPQELFYFARHGKVLYGEHEFLSESAVIERIHKMSQEEYLKAFVPGPPIGSNFWERLNSALIQRDLISVVHNMDFIFGNIPAKRLFLEKDILTSTPQETLREYQKFFKDEPETRIFDNIYEKLYAKIPDVQFMEEIREEEIHGFLRKNTECIRQAAERAAKQTARAT